MFAPTLLTEKRIWRNGSISIYIFVIDITQHSKRFGITREFLRDTKASMRKVENGTDYRIE